jgi:hypothetical protein
MPLVIAGHSVFADNEAVERLQGEKEMNKKSKCERDIAWFLELCFQTFLFIFG